MRSTCFLLQSRQGVKVLKSSKVNNCDTSFLKSEWTTSRKKKNDWVTYRKYIRTGWRNKKGCRLRDKSKWICMNKSAKSSMKVNKRKMTICYSCQLGRSNQFSRSKKRRIWGSCKLLSKESSLRRFASIKLIKCCLNRWMLDSCERRSRSSFWNWRGDQRLLLTSFSRLIELILWSICKRWSSTNGVNLRRKFWELLLIYLVTDTTTKK